MTYVVVCVYIYFIDLLELMFVFLFTIRFGCDILIHIALT